MTGDLDLPALPDTAAATQLNVSADKVWSVMGGLALRRQLLEDEVAQLRRAIAERDAMIAELRAARPAAGTGGDAHGTTG